MKKSLFAFAALAAILAGCAQDIDNQNQVPQPELVVLRASVPEADATRVSADNAGVYRWQTGDKVTVLNTSGETFEFTATTGGTAVDLSSASFTGTLSTEAMYPASDKHATGKFYLEPTIAWSADASMMPMLGTVNTSELTASFKSVGAVIKIPCVNIPDAARKLVVTSATKQLVGVFTPSGDPKVISTADKDESNNILTVTFSADHPANMVFYVPLPTGNLGALTFTIKDGDGVTLFEQATKAAVSLDRNSLVVTPILNCSFVLWSEDWSDYSAGDVPSDKTDREGYGSASITYSQTNGAGSSPGTTQMYEENNAGGVSPELLVGKKGSGEGAAGGTFKASGIPTEEASTMILTFKHKKSVVISLSSGVTAAKTEFNSDGAETVVLTNSGVSSFDLTFTASTANNVRLDDICITKGYAIPTVNTSVATLTIGVGSLSNSMTVTLAHGLDELGVSPILSGADYSWVESVSLSGTTLTATAKSANVSAEEKTATVTLKASGATAKVITLKQSSALVQKPSTISVVPGNATFTAQWAKAAHATGYKAYLCASSGLADPTGGTELTPSLDGSTYSVTQSGLTNGTTYYLYVKVDGVDANYVAEDAYKEVSITPSFAVYYEKITAVGSLTSGERYLIVNESAGRAFKGSITTESDFNTANKTYVSVSVVDGKIVANSTTNAESVVISGSTGNYSIMTAGGYYIGRNTGNGMDYSSDTPKDHAITFDEGNAVIKDNDNNMVLRYNSSWAGFRYYGSGQDPVQLYKLNDPRSAAGLEWQKNSELAAKDTAALLTGADLMPTISLNNPNSLSGITYSSSNTGVATINSSTGAITLVAAGATVISAEFPDGNADYKPLTVSYTLNVGNGRTVCATPTFSPGTSSLATTTDVTITSSTTGSTIYYTIDGSTPTTSSLHGSAGTNTAVVSVTPPLVVKAIAVLDDYKNSEVGSASYSSSSGPELLDNPTGVSITNISIAAKKYEGSWTAVANASSYDWMISTASTAPENTSDASVKAHGNVTTTSFSTSVATAPSSGTVYYLYVRAVGDGGSYETSGYTQARAILYQHVFATAQISTSSPQNDVTLSTITWDITGTNIGSYNGTYKGVQVGTGSIVGSLTFTSDKSWGSQTATSYYGYGTVKKVMVWLNAGADGTIVPSVTIGGVDAISDGTSVKKVSSPSSYANTTAVSFTPGAGGSSGTIVITANKATAGNKAGYFCAIEVLSE